MTDAGSDFVRKLRAELVSAAERRNAQRRHRQRRLLNGVAVLAIIVIATAALQSYQEPTNASVLDVRRENGRTTVNLKATNASSNQIVEELQRHGIDAKITDVPAAPSDIGQFIYLTHESGQGQVDAGPFQQFTLPDSKHQTIELIRGRNASPGEVYAKQPNAYLKGEPLHCSGTLSKRVGDVLPSLHANGLEIEYRFVTNTYSDARTESSVLNAVINNAISTGPNAVTIQVSDTPIPLLGILTDCA